MHTIITRKIYEIGVKRYTSTRKNGAVANCFTAAPFRVYTYLFFKRANRFVSFLGQDFLHLDIIEVVADTDTSYRVRIYGKHIFSTTVTIG